MDSNNKSNPVDTFNTLSPSEVQSILTKAQDDIILMQENGRVVEVILTIFLKNILSKQEAGEFLNDFQKECLLEYLIKMLESLERSGSKAQTLLEQFLH